MAIDPVLQQQSAYQHYSYSSHSHYPQAAYAAHYPYTTPQSTTTTTTTTTTTAAAATTSTASDITTLNDALGSAGVDLRVSSFFFLTPP